MDKHSIPAKLSPPRTHYVLPRKRLFRLMDQQLKRPVLWISSPPGSGKTCLAAGYLQERSRPWIWYSLEPEDTEPGFFFEHLGLAAACCLGRSISELPVFQPFETDQIKFARSFFRSLYSLLPQYPILVWDNFQIIQEDTDLLQVLLHSLQLLPPGANALLLSRSAPPKEFAALLAQDQISFLGWEQLRFRLHESKKLLAHKGLKQEELRNLHHKTQGWAAGLILLAQGIKAGAKESNLYHYLAQELFQNLQPKIQDFLLRTAFLPRFSLRVAQKLTNTADCKGLLDYLLQNNLFILLRQGSSAHYEYHSLFREFLLHTAQKTFSSQEIKQICHQASCLVQGTEFCTDAARLYIQAEDWQGLLNLIQKQAPAMLDQGQAKILQKWLQALPQEILEADPWALYWLGVCCETSAPEQSNVLLKKAWHIFASSSCPLHSPDPARDKWPWLVRVYTLGRFNILIKDLPLVFKAKAQKKSLELLKALLSLEDPYLRMEYLEDLLWPEAEGDRAHSDLSTALYRLRRLLQSKDTVLVQENKACLNPSCVWVDAWSFKGKLRRTILRGPGTATNWPEIKTGFEINLLHQAFFLYQGHFLPQDFELEWTRNTRNRLQQDYLFLVLTLAKLLQERGQHAAAAKRITQALGIMELEEELYLVLFPCLLAMQEPALAEAWAIRCSKKMAAAGKRPCSRLQTLLHKLQP
ncbi:MAG: BTAD domain-containing putative transcriptional regulator [Desulfohalobiaceae bacterium]